MEAHVACRDGFGACWPSFLPGTRCTIILHASSESGWRSLRQGPCLVSSIGATDPLSNSGPCSSASLLAGWTSSWPATSISSPSSQASRRERRYITFRAAVRVVRTRSPYRRSPAYDQPSRPWNHFLRSHRDLGLYVKQNLPSTIARGVLIHFRGDLRSADSLGFDVTRGSAWSPIL